MISREKCSHIVGLLCILWQFREIRRTYSTKVKCFWVDVDNYSWFSWMIQYFPKSFPHQTIRHIKHNVLGYVLLSTFSLLETACLGGIIYSLSEGSYALLDTLGGAVCALSILVIIGSLIGVVTSHCCHRPPPDNRVAHSVAGFTVWQAHWRWHKPPLVLPSCYDTYSLCHGLYFFSAKLYTYSLASPTDIQPNIYVYWKTETMCCFLLHHGLKMIQYLSDQGRN